MSAPLPASAVAASCTAVRPRGSRTSRNRRPGATCSARCRCRRDRRANRAAGCGWKAARERRYDPGRFSFNVAKGRCGTCEGEGFVSVELLFMPSVYAPCPDCHGARYNPQTLEILWNGKSIADVLRLTVEEAVECFAD